MNIGFIIPAATFGTKASMTRPIGTIEEVFPSEEPLKIGLAVDFGSTSSGVAFDDGKVKPVPWPPKGGGNKNYFGKIPTAISYDKDGKVTKWGFECGQGQPGVKYLFKSLLDPQIWNTSQQIRDGIQSGFDSLDEVRCCVRDYLTLLMENALGVISNRTMRNDLIVNLTLTRPTTWTAAVVVDYQTLAMQAFEEVRQRRKNAICLRLNSLRDETESHAAGIYVFQKMESMNENRSILYVLDVGGATTDPALLQAVRDSSGRQKLKSLLNPPVRGIQIGCAELDNLLSDHVLLLLRSIWEQENFGADMERSPSVLLMMASRAKALIFDKDWVERRDRFSKDAVFPSFKLEIPDIPSDEKNGVLGLQGRNIIITRNDMNVIFDKALIAPIRDQIDDILKILSSLQLPGETSLEIAHIILCGGGGLIPRVYECVRDRLGQAVTRTNELMAPSLGALYIVQDEVCRMHDKLEVGTKKPGGNSEDVNWLENSKQPIFPRKWKHHVAHKVADQEQHFVFRFTDEPNIIEEWAVNLQIEITRRSRFEFLQKRSKYQVCLTLPSTTSAVTPLDFSAFQISKDGREVKIGCNARKIM